MPKSWLDRLIKRSLSHQTLLNEARRIAARCDRHTRRQAFLKIFRISRDLRDFRSAEKAAAGKRSFDSEYSALESVRVLAAAGFPEEARAIAAGISDPLRRLQSFGTIFEYRGVPEDLAACRRAAGRKDSSWPSTYMQRELDRVRACAGDVRAALRVAETDDFHSSVSEHETDKRIVITEALARGGHLAAARQFARRSDYWPHHHAELSLVIYRHTRDPRDLGASRRAVRRLRACHHDWRMRCWLEVFRASGELKDLAVPLREASAPHERVKIHAAAFSASREPCYLEAARKAAAEIAVVSREYGTPLDRFKEIAAASQTAAGRARAFAKVYAVSFLPEDLLEARRHASVARWRDRVDAFLQVFTVSKDAADLRSSLEALYEWLRPPRGALWQRDLVEYFVAAAGAVAKQP